MNQIIASPKFFLNVSGPSSEVWPYVKDSNPINDRIIESYFADEDLSSTGFEITDMEDLVSVLKYYDGKNVELSLTFEVKSSEMESHATLGSKYFGQHGSYRFLQEGTLSPKAAASKLVSISHALERWEKQQTTGN